MRCLLKSVIVTDAADTLRTISINKDDFEVQHIIGRGHFGEVCLYDILLCQLKKFTHLLL